MPQRRQGAPRHSGIGRGATVPRCGTAEYEQRVPRCQVKGWGGLIPTKTVGF